MSGFYTQFFYPVALVLPTEGLFESRMILPSDAEVELLSAWSVFHVNTRHPYEDNEVFRTDVFTTVPGVDTHHFGKTTDGWMLRVSSWNDKLFPRIESPTRFWDLISILDHVERHTEGWLLWRERNSFLISATLS